VNFNYAIIWTYIKAYYYDKIFKDLESEINLSQERGVH